MDSKLEEQKGICSTLKTPKHLSQLMLMLSLIVCLSFVFIASSYASEYTELVKPASVPVVKSEFNNDLVVEVKTAELMTPTMDETLSESNGNLDNIDIAQSSVEKPILPSSMSLSFNRAPLTFSEISPEKNHQLLFEHLQLLALGTHQPNLVNYWQQFSISTGHQYELADKIANEIVAFWQSKGITLPASRESSASADKLVNYMAIEPPADDYLDVVSHIRRLMWLDKQYSFQPIQLNGLLRPGDGHARVIDIAERLWVYDDLASFEKSQYTYQGEIVEAVKRFQTRHGLKADAVIGPKTLYWLNRTPLERASLLARSFIDKTSYLHTLPNRYLLVNIPSFEMFLMDNQQLALYSRVIVGKSTRQTPLMIGNISNIVLNPTWTVPRNLMRLDLLPKIALDGSYLTKENFDVFNYQGQIVWLPPEELQLAARGSFPFRLVQRAGEFNTLGRYKFHFNNDNNIYLHDTNKKYLFAESDRALSSGCVRIEKVEQLATWFADNLIIDKRTWSRLQNDRIKTQWFSLNQTLPVHFVYWTAWVDNNHQAQYRQDIYQKYGLTQLAQFITPKSANSESNSATHSMTSAAPSSITAKSSNSVSAQKSALSVINNAEVNQ